MKKYIIIAITLLALYSCNTSTGPLDTKKQIETQRIVAKECTIVQGYCFLIIEIDSVEYIAGGNGGIYPLVKTK